MITSGMISSKTVLWEIPQWLFDQLNNEFHFTLDCCATFENRKCDNYFSPENDGLKQEWMGQIWMNPPYGKQIGKWVKKAFESGRDGNIVVALLPSRTDPKWFHDYVYGKAEIRFLKGRLYFVSESKSNNGRAPFPSMIVIWR